MLVYLFIYCSIYLSFYQYIAAWSVGRRVYLSFEGRGVVRVWVFFTGVANGMRWDGRGSQWLIADISHHRSLAK